MSVIQLCRYQLTEGVLADWAAHWRQNVMPLRLKFGFNVLFAFADHVNSQFVWAVSFDGTAEDLAARDHEYHESPEWAERNAGKNGPIESVTVALVEEIAPPTAAIPV